MSEVKHEKWTANCEAPKLDDGGWNNERYWMAVSVSEERDDDWIDVVADVFGNSPEECARRGRLIENAPDIYALLTAVLPLMRESAPKFRYQKPGNEFWPNREEVEGVISDIEGMIARVKGEL